jgi:hypothetical protein
MLAAMAVTLLAALTLSVGELGRHGWSSFIFRDAGTGATAATQADLNLPKARSAPVARPPQVIVVMIVPQLAHRATMTVTIMVWKGERLLVVPKWPPP